uniref:Replication enhancer n=1 Tax=Tomato leaf curl virus TaxID=28350 RepID=A0A6G9IY07_9GEMI|nr:replication enhancer protein [Tomato leaf curl virus]QIQ31313.1 replication enhancer protein [Tomato leaf curl virus]QIQ31331.1 replication enhancer protein [Tomato leaf curl virus]QIQ31355.1 replication enhancer protein [Tomato leaf curl virus]QIQ31361.1 replication enhancer protein [Tomato leaf curl virus]
MDLRTGELITAHQAQSGVYTWEIANPLYFSITEHSKRPFNYNHDIITVQLRFNHNLRKELGIHKCFMTYKIWTTLQPQTGLFLRVFKTQVRKYLDNLGVISINNVIRAIEYVLFDVINGTLWVEQNYDIKFKLY